MNSTFTCNNWEKSERKDWTVKNPFAAVDSAEVKVEMSTIHRTGFEPVLLPWKGSVLTPWPTVHEKDKSLLFRRQIRLQQATGVLLVRAILTSRVDKYGQMFVVVTAQLNLLQNNSLTNLAGIEPTLTVLETAVLPLNYRSLRWISLLYHLFARM